VGSVGHEASLHYKHENPGCHRRWLQPLAVATGIGVRPSILRRRSWCADKTMFEIEESKACPRGFPKEQNIAYF
jgi:hypothetical protein